MNETTRLKLERDREIYEDMAESDDEYIRRLAKTVLELLDREYR